jgi:hypothetical protein
MATAALAGWLGWASVNGLQGVSHTASATTSIPETARAAFVPTAAALPVRTNAVAAEALAVEAGAPPAPSTAAKSKPYAPVSASIAAKPAASPASATAPPADAPAPRALPQALPTRENQVELINPY